jgi:hypothetical protein
VLFGPHPTRSIAAAVLALTLVGAVAGCSAGSEGSGSGSAGGSGASSSGSEAAPTLTAVDVASGSVTGGTTVTLTGTGLAGASAVTIGDNPAAMVSGTDEQIVVTTPAAANFATGPAAIVVTGADGATVASTLSYEYAVVTPVDAQMNYALAHWQNRNVAEYGSYGDNDCVNFTSQSLIARGWVEDSEWYHNAGSDGTHSYSSAWLSSTAMMRYFKARPELATALTDDQRDQVVVGDVVQFDWDNSGDRDHTGIVSRIEGTGADRVIYFAGHSLDSDYRSVDVAITTDHPGGTAYYWHLEA